MGNHKEHSRGFTLIELLVSMAIIVIIIAAVYTAFNSGRASWQVGDTMMQRYQKARGILDYMTREISKAVVDEAASLYGYEPACFACRGYASGAAPKTPLKSDEFGMPSHQFYFVAPVEHITTASRIYDLYRVGYWLDPGNNLQRVFAEPDDSSDFVDAYDLTDPSMSSQPVASNVTWLEFEYYYYDYQASGGGRELLSATMWDSTGDQYPRDGVTDGLPAAMKVTITVADDMDSKQQTFSTMIYFRNNYFSKAE